MNNYYSGCILPTAYYLPISALIAILVFFRRRPITILQFLPSVVDYVASH